jgi:hypothetical protein
MERHPAIVVSRANGVGGCIDEELNDIECDIFVPACKVEGRTPFIISSTDSGREIFQKTTNYSLVDFFILTCLKEEIIIAEWIFGFPPVSLNQSA